MASTPRRKFMSLRNCARTSVETTFSSSGNQRVGEPPAARGLRTGRLSASCAPRRSAYDSDSLRPTKWSSPKILEKATRTASTPVALHRPAARERIFANQVVGSSSIAAGGSSMFVSRLSTETSNIIGSMMAIIRAICR